MTAMVHKEEDEHSLGSSDTSESSDSYSYLLRVSVCLYEALTVPSVKLHYALFNYLNGLYYYVIIIISCFK